MRAYEQVSYAVSLGVALLWWNALVCTLVLEARWYWRQKRSREIAVHRSIPPLYVVLRPEDIQRPWCQTAAQYHRPRIKLWAASGCNLGGGRLCFLLPVTTCLWAYQSVPTRQLLVSI